MTRLLIGIIGIMALAFAAAAPLLTADPAGLFNDNLLYTTSPFVDALGFGFTTPDGVQWSVWNSGWCNNSVTGGAYFCEFPPDPAGTVTSYQVSETPLPAALPLFATGLGALALLGWRRKRTARGFLS
jgi:hypothetical protein